MARTTAQWKAIYKARNARRKTLSRAERKANREMGRHLSTKSWAHSTGAPRIPAEPKKVVDK